MKRAWTNWKVEKMCLWRLHKSKAQIAWLQESAVWCHRHENLSYLVERDATIWFFSLFNKPSFVASFDFSSCRHINQTRPDTHANSRFIIIFHLSCVLKFKSEKFQVESKSVNSVDELRRKIQNLLPWQIYRERKQRHCHFSEAKFHLVIWLVRFYLWSQI